LRSSRAISVRELTPATRRRAVTIMMRVKKDLHHYQSFQLFRTEKRSRVFQTSNGTSGDMPGANECVRFNDFHSVDCASPSSISAICRILGTVLSVPEQPVSIMPPPRLPWETVEIPGWLAPQRLRRFLA
jgi:hypothetical protein